MLLGAVKFLHFICPASVKHQNVTLPYSQRALREQPRVAKDMVIPATARKADAVKILEDLNRQLSPDVEPIAEVCRAG